MKTTKGPALFLAQCVSDGARFAAWGAITHRNADCGWLGVQVPGWKTCVFDIETAKTSRDDSDTFKGAAAENDITVTELSACRRCEMVSVHLAFDVAFGGFTHPPVRGDPTARLVWAVGQRTMAPDAWRELGLVVLGAWAWPCICPWPHHHAEPMDAAFDKLAARWRPVLDQADKNGIDICHEIHPGEVLHDGIRSKTSGDLVDRHPRARTLDDQAHHKSQCLEYTVHPDAYDERIGRYGERQSAGAANPRAEVPIRTGVVRGGIDAAETRHPYRSGDTRPDDPSCVIPGPGMDGLRFVNACARSCAQDSTAVSP